MTTERREELKGIVRAICAEAERRIDDPKNVAKGDGWNTMDWEELFSAFRDEGEEFEDAVEEYPPGGRHDPLHEAGDTVVRMAQILDKKAVETFA